MYLLLRDLSTLPHVVCYSRDSGATNSSFLSCLHLFYLFLLIFQDETTTEEVEVSVSCLCDDVVSKSHSLAPPETWKYEV